MNNQPQKVRFLRNAAVGGKHYDRGATDTFPANVVRELIGSRAAIIASEGIENASAAPAKETAALNTAKKAAKKAPKK